MGRRGLLRRCVSCGRYTLNTQRCPYCGGSVRSPHPARFSPEDPYRRYRRLMKLGISSENLNNQGVSTT